MNLRERNFELARSLHAGLGAVFQNPIKITYEDILQELVEIHNLEVNLLEYKRRVLSEVARTTLRMEVSK